MGSITTVYEFDRLIADADFKRFDKPTNDLRAVPDDVFKYLEDHYIYTSCKEPGKETAQGKETYWLRPGRYASAKIIQVTNYVGVVRTPGGHQIEVLPKIGKSNQAGQENNHEDVRDLLIQMLSCLREFPSSINVGDANLRTTRMNLLEIFIRAFLESVKPVVKHGLRKDYINQRDNLFVLRGKLLVSQHLRHNLVRPDRFYTEHDEFSVNRPINRLLSAALQRVMSWTTSAQNQQLARQLQFAFADVPPSTNPHADFQRVRWDRGMKYYEEALSWAKLILNTSSPLTNAGQHRAPTLLFPMERVFEAYVGRHLPKQFPEYKVRKQAKSFHLVKHDGKKWFGLKPDFIFRDKDGETCAVLDTKWKLLDQDEKQYGLSQSDFYQMYAYGKHYLDDKGFLMLIYPKTDRFDKPLPVFDFPGASPTGSQAEAETAEARPLRLYVAPFCLKKKKLMLRDIKLILCEDRMNNSLMKIN